MKYLITGLGNPGTEYKDTRHNAGFMVVDALAEKHSGVFTPDRFGWTCKIKIKGRLVILFKPDTYMNLSGKGVRFHLSAEKLEPSELLVVTDDLALPFGKIRIRPSGSAGGHNGLQNIEDILGTNAYARMRLGIGNEFLKGKQVDYVLNEFEPEEKEKLPEVIKTAGQAIESFIFIGLARTMSQFNR